MASVEWETSLETVFSELQTVINIFTPASDDTDDDTDNYTDDDSDDVRVRRSVSTEHRSKYLPYNQTHYTIPLEDVSWESEITLQMAVHDTLGDASARVKLFEDLVDVGPPDNVRANHAVDDDDGAEVSLSWENRNTNDDGSSVPLPLILTLFTLDDDGDFTVLDKQSVDGAAAPYTVELASHQDDDNPWDIAFSLAVDQSKLGLKNNDDEVDPTPLFGALQLDPPDLIAGLHCNNSDVCHFSWCHSNSSNYVKVSLQLR